MESEQRPREDEKGRTKQDVTLARYSQVWTKVVQLISKKEKVIYQKKQHTNFKRVDLLVEHG